MSATTSIEGLRLYQSSRKLEDAIYEMVKRLPQTEFYQLGNDLRRSSAGVSHYITECHRRYSYSVKLEALYLARTESETLQRLLQAHQAQGYGDTKALQNACTGIIKQTWGLIRFLKQRQAERQQDVQRASADQLVAARS